ncbi:hypothetical protein OfM1_18750 [Lactovum odontotermitis]
MKKLQLLAGFALSLFTMGAALPVHAETNDVPRDQAPVYRLYNKNTGEHFYTSGVYELINLQRVGWTSEGIGWYAPVSGDAVYRIYNPNAEGGDHYYTKSKFEAEHDVSLGWKWDNDGKPVFYSGGDVPDYVAYNPNAKSGAHNYTTGTYEQNKLLSLGWIYGATAWQALKEGTSVVNLDQIMNKDTATIQGLWKNNQGKILQVIGNQFILDGKNITNAGTTDNPENNNIWNTVHRGDSALAFSVNGTGGYAIEIVPAGIIQGPDDKADSGRARIVIGQDKVYSTEHAFYQV